MVKLIKEGGNFQQVKLLSASWDSGCGMAFRVQSMSTPMVVKAQVNSLMHEDEIKTLAKVQHPNVVAFYGYFARDFNLVNVHTNDVVKLYCYSMEPPMFV